MVGFSNQIQLEKQSEIASQGNFSTCTG